MITGENAAYVTYVSLLQALFSKEIEQNNAALKGLEAGRRTALKLKGEVRAGLRADRRNNATFGKFQLKSINVLVDVLKAPLRPPMPNVPNAQRPTPKT